MAGCFGGNHGTSTGPELWAGPREKEPTLCSGVVCLLVKVQAGRSAVWGHHPCAPLGLFCPGSCGWLAAQCLELMCGRAAPRAVCPLKARGLSELYRTSRSLSSEPAGTTAPDYGGPSGLLGHPKPFKGRR